MAFHRMSRDVLSRPGLLVPHIFLGGVGSAGYMMWIDIGFGYLRNDTHRIVLSNDIKSCQIKKRAYHHILYEYLMTAKHT